MMIGTLTQTTVYFFWRKLETAVSCSRAYRRLIFVCPAIRVWRIRTCMCMCVCVFIGAHRFEAYGWHTQVVADGTDTSAIMEAVENAKLETGRPSIIKTKTIIGHGSQRQVRRQNSRRRRAKANM